MGKPVQLIPNVLSKSNIINNRQFEHSRCDYTIIPFFKFFSDGQNDTRSMQEQRNGEILSITFLREICRHLNLVKYQRI
jgi:hypothetical protein